MPRLPEPGRDAGNWGNILNDYIAVAHENNGELKSNTVGGPQLKANAVTNAAIATGTIQENKLHSDLQTKLSAIDGKINTTSVGIANGVASLDGTAKLPEAHMPARLSAETVNSTVNALADDAIKTLAMDIRAAFSGTKLIAYGASWTQYGSYDTQPYMTYLPDLLGFSEVINRGRAASRTQDLAVMVTQSGHPLSWDTSQRGVVIIDGLGNNLIEADTSNNRAAAIEQLRAIIALASASSRVEQTTFTFSSGWNDTASVQPYASGGTAAITSAGNGEYLDIPAPAEDFYVLMHGVDGTSARGGRFTFTQGAIALGSKLLDGTTVRTGREADNGAAPVVYKITGHTAGTIRATFDNNGVPGALGIIDAILPQSSTPPLIVLLKVMPLTAPTHNKPVLYNYLRTLPDIMANEFGKHVIVVDPAPGWNASTMLGADGLHPTRLGVDHLNRTIVSTVKATIWRRQVEAAFGASLT